MMEILHKTLNDHIALPKRPAAGRKRRAQKSPRMQATLPPNEHKAVRWELGDRHKTSSKESEKRETRETMSTAKSPRCLAGVKDDNGKSSTFF